jgi:hypothetical protein
MEIEKNYIGTIKEMETLFNDNEYINIKYYEQKEKIISKHNTFNYTLIIRFNEEYEKNIKMIRTLKGLLKLEKSIKKRFN